MERRNSLKNIMDKAGKIVRTEKVTEGKSGNNLMLTVDMDLQKRVEGSLEKEFTSLSCCRANDGSCVRSNDESEKRSNFINGRKENCK